jgi:hypothetical protein
MSQDESITQAREIVRVVAESDPAPMLELDLAMSDPPAYVQRAESHGIYFANSRDELDLLAVAIDALEWHGYVAGIDHNADTDELVEALSPLLERHGVDDFDWSFIEQLQQAKKWDALKNANLLPLVGQKVGERQLVLAFLNLGSDDNFLFSVITEAQFQQWSRLSGAGFTVSRSVLP